ncbi:MAG: hypothetical protein HC775_04990 [Hyellaceae cyanobacterium CSU_1_1]|nr:hypothetical protein [Hyellaceae cyanobacterium CSU_1_1]
MKGIADVFRTARNNSRPGYLRHPMIADNQIGQTIVQAGKSGSAIANGDNGTTRQNALKGTSKKLRTSGSSSTRRIANRCIVVPGCI